MASSGAELEAMLVRTTVVSLALQTLVGRLVSNGTLGQTDLAATRETGLQLAADLRAHGGTGAQIGGAQLKGGMAGWWDIADAMSSN